VGRGPVLSDEVWARIEPLLPAQYGKGRPFRDHRQVIEGIVFRYRCGIAWRDLPERFGPWQTVWKRHHRFSLDGTWDEVLAILQAEADAAGEIDWRVSVDSSTSRVHQHAATAQRSSEGPSSYTGGEIESQEAAPPAGEVAAAGAVAARPTPH
jgi:transposase